MIKITTVIVSLWLAAIAQCNAAVSYWSFTNYTSSTTLSANQGAGTLSVTGGTPSGVAGTTINQIAGYDTNPGGAMSFVNPTRTGVATSFVLQFSQGGMTDFILTYAYNPGNAGYGQQWQWSTNGTAFNTFTSITAAAVGWQSATVDFSSVTALEGAGVSSIWIRNNITGPGNNGNSTIAFDNIQINAVPEPTTIAASIFGGLFIFSVLGRRILKRAG